MAAPIVLATGIAASEEAIMDAVSTTAGLASFWTADSLAEPGVGSIAVFGFGTRGGKLEMRVDEVQPGRIAWTVLNDFPRVPPLWKGTTLSYELKTNEDGYVDVVFQHGNWPAELPQVELAFSAYVWASVLRALKGYTESGKARPLFSPGPLDGLSLTRAWEGASGSAGRTESTSNS
jgi:uncharacterized protein YndB with AHSA1/START domain